MDQSDVVRRRRMVRSFSGAALDPGVLETVLSVVARAPSAGNTGAVDAVVLEGEDQTAVFWDATTTEEWRTTSRRWPGFSRAPVVVALFVHIDAYAARYHEPDKVAADPNGIRDWPVPYWFVDGGFTAMLLLLAAVDAGIGACFLGNFRGEAELRAALGVPADRAYVGAVLLGEPDGADHRSPSLDRGRRPAEEVVHRGRW